MFFVTIFLKWQDVSERDESHSRMFEIQKVFSNLWQPLKNTKNTQKWPLKAIFKKKKYDFSLNFIFFNVHYFFRLSVEKMARLHL